MSGKSLLPIKKFYVVLFLTGAIILVASLEAIIAVKDADLFLQWADENFPGAVIDSHIFSQFVSSNLALYFLKILIPGTIALTAYISATKSMVTWLMSYVWVVLGFGGLAFAASGMDFQSLFFYLNGVLYTALILFIYFSIGISRQEAGGER